jgi:lysyl-tRNA synthetase class 1
MWAEQKSKDILKSKKKEGNVFATGITPSGPIHVGNTREVMTAELVYRLVKKTDKRAKLIYVADDFDNLRKVYPFLPDEYEKYVGQPLVNIPDPEGCHESYADHFLDPFFKSLEKLGVEVERLSATKMYQEGKFKEQITIALKNRDKIVKIIEEGTGRDIPDDWQPFDPLCEKCGRIDSGKIEEIDYDNTTVSYICKKCGHAGKADWSKGQGKLPWRIDWPARWQILGVTVEPFGKDHGAAGGSYEVGAVLSKEVFDYQAPYPIPYEFIYLKGSKGKMASSTGNVVSLDDLLKVTPPQLVRYMFATKKPNRHIEFDPGEGLIKMINQYSQLEEIAKEGQLTGDKKLVYQLSQVDDSRLPMASFRHLVEAYQAAQGDMEEIKRILKNTGHQDDLKNEEALNDQIVRVKTWLDKYAPDQYKFEIEKEVPEINISDKQKELLVEIADKLIQDDPEAEEIHNYIYQTGKELGLKPKESFEVIYLSLLGQTSGPKAGWFIDLLDKDFVIERFKQIGEGN